MIAPVERQTPPAIASLEDFTFGNALCIPLVSMVPAASIVMTLSIPVVMALITPIAMVIIPVVIKKTPRQD
jgi:hypothetical protein